MGNNKPMMLEKRAWSEFKDSGLLWFINHTLHLFGWAIAMTIEQNGEISEVFPARCRFRGFSTESEVAGYEQLTRHIQENINEVAGDL